MKPFNLSSATKCFGIACGVAISFNFPCLASESFTDGNLRVDKHSAYKSVVNRAAGEKNEDYDTLTLDMVRDVGVSLKQVRELAIYIFKEATRRKIALTDPPEIKGFDQISEDDLDVNAPYLKPRPGWIFFYVGTLEPIIQLLKDAESERIYIPRKIKDQEVKLAAEFDALLDKTRHEVRKLHKYIDGDPHESVDVARCALAIYDAANAMEVIRRQSYEAVRDAEKNGHTDMVLF